jgi:hypothetical protein
MTMTASHLRRLRSILLLLLPFHEIGSARQSVVVDQRLSDVIVRKLCRIHFVFSQTCCYYVEPVSAVGILMYG